MPRKFLRILIEIMKLVRLFAGRGRSASPSESQKPMDIHLLERQLDQAIKGLHYWKNERRELGNLVAPVTDWKLLSHTNLVKNYSQQLVDRIDELIPTHKLYVDLYNTAE